MLGSPTRRPSHQRYVIQRACSLVSEFSSLSLNAVWTLWAYLELGAIWLWAFGVDFRKDFWGLLVQSGLGAEKLNGGFIATSHVSPVSFVQLLQSPPPLPSSLQV